MTDQQIKKQTFPVLGMSCAACAARVNKTLSRQEGVCSANVNLATAIATVEYDPSLCSPEMMKQAVQNAGFDLLIDTAKEAEKEDEYTHAAHMGYYPIASCRYYRNVFHGYAICQLHHVDIIYSCSVLAGKRILCQCLEAAEAPFCQYGHTGGKQYRNRLSVQLVQLVFSRFLAIKGSDSACVF